MENKFKNILVISVILLIAIVFALGIGFLTTEKASAAQISCPSGEILCGDSCYAVPYCYECDTVSDCDDSGLGCETYKCNGGSGGGGPVISGQHYCYCSTN